MRIVLRAGAIVLLLLLSCVAAERRHDATSHHSFADVEHWSTVFDDPSRDAWQKRALPVGPPPEHKLAREQVVEEMEAAGYALIGEPGLLPYQYFLVFRPR